MIRVGIAGAAGYTAGELIRLLVNHPSASIIFAQSESNAGRLITEVHEGLIGDTELRFTPEVDLGAIDVLFLCGAHGKSSEFWAAHPRPAGLKVIDLAQDYRDESDGYVYGLPEWQAGRIAGADKVANPGCFATAIQLSLLPLAAAGLLQGEVTVTAVTGSTGAGTKPSATTHFSWRNNNISAYKVLAHQHLAEIRRNLAAAARGSAGGGVTGDVTGNLAPAAINFIPLRGDFARGIFSTAILDCSLTQEQAENLYRDYYAPAPFTFLSAAPVDLKQVVNTNKCVLHLETRDGKLVITAAIDNLLKGASGQAVQNLNLMFGLPENEGLKLKASAF